MVAEVLEAIVFTMKIEEWDLRMGNGYPNNITYEAYYVIKK
jgi:hypothetical protein